MSESGDASVKEESRIDTTGVSEENVTTDFEQTETDYDVSVYSETTEHSIAKEHFVSLDDQDDVVSHIDDEVISEVTTVKEAEIGDEDDIVAECKRIKEERARLEKMRNENARLLFEGKESSRSIELEELPQDDDVTAEELELNQPLDTWVSDLMPGMREILAPQLYSSSEVMGLPPGESFEPLDPCPIPAVLISQSPMMIRFQKTLRNHLLRQKEKLENDIYDMEKECMGKDKEIKDIALTINREQEHLNKQKDLLQKYNIGIEEVTAKRKQYDSALGKKTKDLKETEVSYKENVTEDKSLGQQYEEMKELVYRLYELEKMQNTELKLAKNLSEKQKADKIKLANEKQLQDLFIWKLNKELEHLGLETTALIQETEIKKNEVGQLTQIVTDIEADTEALRKENSMIICATQQLVHEIKKRDKGYIEAESKVGKALSELQIILTRIRSYNKSLKSEDERHAMIQSSKCKLVMLIQRTEHQAEMLSLRQEEGLEKLAQIKGMLDSLESEGSKKNSTANDLLLKHKTLTNEVDDLVLKRSDLKKKYLSVMSEMKIQTCMTQKLQKSMEELSHENQDIGLRKLEVDCKVGELMSEIEHSKVKRVQLEVKIDNIKNKIKEKETVLKSLEVQKKKLHQQIQSYRSKVIGSNKRLENLIKFNDDSAGRNQLARRVNCLNIELSEIDEKIGQAKQTWMDTQNSLIEQSYKLSQVESMTNTVRKHLYITKYKREKLDAKVSELEGEKKQAVKDFTWFHNKLISMTLENYRNEQAKERLEELSKEAENRFVTVLKDAEETAVNLHEELCYLEEGNKEMSEEIERLQREFLAWEKKWKMAVEARERVEKERAATGEIGAMKLEIHRMQVRFSQLQKVQEKLSQDLELCISRRDNIMDSASAKERKASSTKKSYTRDQFNKKLDSIKQKIKQIKSSLKTADKDINELELRKEELMDECLKKQKQLTEVKLGVDKLETEIQEGQLHKYKSLELVVRQQRKIRLLDDIKHKRYRLFSKTESNISTEEEKQENNGCNLVEVVQSLTVDFPKLKLQLLQIYNTLMSPVE